MTLLSHSDGRRLDQHLDEVVAAARSILATHTLSFPGLPPATLAAALDLTAATHDVAKATSHFQAYIRNEPYNSALKPHALLSACYAFHRARGLPDLPWGEVIPGLIACAVAGHHSAYPGFADLATTVFRSLDTLHQQLDTLDPTVFAMTPGGVSLAGGFTHADLDRVAGSLRALARSYPRRPLEEKIRHRILGLFLVSVLLEADRTVLALGRLPADPPLPLPATAVPEHITTLPVYNTEIGRIRGECLARAASTDQDQPIQTLTLPTGTGKTLTALHRALALRARAAGAPPRIVVAMPYLSVIEQTDEVYRAVLQDEIAAEGDRVHLSSHSLAPFRYRAGEGSEDDNAVEFLLSTWQAAVVTTTFDQVLYALFSRSPRHLIRFHTLLNAVLLIDEVQALPAALWLPVNRFLTALTEIGQTRVIALSATQPGVFPGAAECVPDPGRYFERLNRVRLTIRYAPETVPAFCDRILPALREAPAPTLIVLNTIAACEAVYRDLGARLDRPVHYLSARLPPALRSARLEAVKREMAAGENPILVATQCIEAGVDIDMGRVYRDFGPLDAIIQICGRCNRHGTRARGEVEVVRLVTEDGDLYARQVYDDPRLDATLRALAGTVTLDEPAFPARIDRYFAEVRDEAERSEKVACAFAEGSDTLSVRALLRGEDDGISFVIGSCDPGLREELRAVARIEDRWERRYALKRLLPRVARCSVSLRVSEEDADRMTDEVIYGFRFVREPYYDSEGVGLSENPSWGLIL